MRRGRGVLRALRAIASTWVGRAGREAREQGAGEKGEREREGGGGGRQENGQVRRREEGRGGGGDLSARDNGRAMGEGEGGGGGSSGGLQGHVIQAGTAPATQSYKHDAITTMRHTITTQSGRCVIQSRRNQDDESYNHDAITTMRHTITTQSRRYVIQSRRNHDDAIRTPRCNQDTPCKRTQHPRYKHPRCGHSQHATCNRTPTVTQSDTTCAIRSFTMGDTITRNRCTCSTIRQGSPPHPAREDC